MPPHGSSFSTQEPVWQVALSPQLPQEPPQPSAPHSLPAQLGSQLAPHISGALLGPEPEPPKRPFVARSGPHAVRARDVGRAVHLMDKWVANDKALFTELVTLILDESWTTETREASDPATLAGLLLELGGRYATVGLKRTRCASAMGNLVLDSTKGVGFSFDE